MFGALKVSRSFPKCLYKTLSVSNSLACFALDGNNFLDNKMYSKQFTLVSSEGEKKEGAAATNFQSGV